MISVVFPFRDAAVTVGAALDSVLVEGCVGEVIAVDDARRPGNRGHDRWQCRCPGRCPGRCQRQKKSHASGKADVAQFEGRGDRT
jgi:hypothetical protein